MLKVITKDFGLISHVHGSTE